MFLRLTLLADDNVVHTLDPFAVGLLIYAGAAANNSTGAGASWKAGMPCPDKSYLVFVEKESGSALATYSYATKELATQACLLLAGALAHASWLNIPPEAGQGIRMADATMPLPNIADPRRIYYPDALRRYAYFSKFWPLVDLRAKAVLESMPPEPDVPGIKKRPPRELDLPPVEGL